MTDSEPSWKRVTQHKPTGREIYQRTIEFRTTGNNEGTMEDEIEVREADGTVIAGTSVRIDWEYYGFVQADFECDGMEVHIDATDKETEVLTLPPICDGSGSLPR